jgi:hypothetical protein
MGNVVGFRKRKLTGFLPDDLGMAALDRRRDEQLAREQMLALIRFAKTGQPTIPDDCA